MVGFAVAEWSSPLERGKGSGTQGPVLGAAGCPTSCSKEDMVQSTCPHRYEWRPSGVAVPLVVVVKLMLGGIAAFIVYRYPSLFDPLALALGRDDLERQVRPGSRNDTR